MRPSIVATLAAAAALLASPAPAAAQLSDAQPSGKHIAANAEFLLDLPPGPGPSGICVIDTGVTPIRDLQDAIVERRAYYDGNPDDVRHTDADPYSGHGTFVASAAASRVDGWGTAGIWPAAKIYSIRIFPQSGQATAADYRLAVRECAEFPNVGVINLSLGGVALSELDAARLEDAVRTAQDEYRQSVVGSVGNGGGSVSHPASIPSVLGVGASDARPGICPFSNRGAGLDLLAPGCPAEVSGFDGSPGEAYGTSYASGIVAGTLAALRSHRPHLSVTDLERFVLDGAHAAEGARALDARASFALASVRIPAPSAPSPSGQPPPATQVAVPPVVPEAVRPSAVLRRPSVKRIVRRRGLVTLLLSGRPTGGSSDVRAGRRRWRRQSSRLALPLARGSLLRIRFVTDGGEAGPTLRVRVRR